MGSTNKKELYTVDSPAAVARQYVDALSAKDFATVTTLYADDLVWHQPGANRFSGTLHGPDAVNAMIGAMMTVSQGTFELAVTGAPMVNGDQVAVPVHFSGRRDGATLGQDGVDVLRVQDGRIAEVRLFSSAQKDEDTFWGTE